MLRGDCVAGPHGSLAPGSFGVRPGRCTTEVQPRPGRRTRSSSGNISATSRPHRGHPRFTAMGDDPGMWIAESLPLQLQRWRQERGLSQRRLAADTGLLQARISDFERGVRTPGLEAMQALAGGLGLPLAEMARRTAWRKPKPGRPTRQRETGLLLRFTPDVDQIYRPPRKRDFAFHMAAVRDRFASVLAWLEPRFDARPDSREVELFLRDFPADSADEALFYLLAVTSGCTCLHVAPAGLGFFYRPVIDPGSRVVVGHRRRAALTLEFEGATIVLMPQVAVRPRETIIMDALVGVREGLTTWVDLEIDGGGHDPRRDDERTQALGLPVLRVTTQMLQEPDFMTRTLLTLLWIHRNRFRGVVRELRV